MVALLFMLVLSISSVAEAQYDRDPQTKILYQHMPMRRGDRAPYEGVLLDGRRYATLKLAELRLALKEQQFASFERSYSELEQYASQCRVQLARDCPPAICPPPKEWYESTTFWVGLVGGILTTAIVSLIVATS